ncbi:preprotein translocase subunit SecA [Paenibacillus thiaminolyticus]|uniref:preprotein translocase subunit SecA n=1 Tax=Paenibacillus thiaminolyticus TaxID=49283 RepID=UPI001162455D|nr:preprotein translocase subunit SecA [Paenibacillus thiaminolyticus]NGP59600.1 preprotein translocase subunit SecA [Paenibacillus thiaminolyticus]
MLFRLAKRIFDRQSTEIRKLRRIVSHIDRHSRQLSSSSDEQLQSLSQELRSKAEEARGSPRMKVEAFALAKEAVRRISGKTLHDVQLMGGWAMTERNIAEMATGEGKTATSILPIYWFALQGHGVHLITANEYLAGRDYAEMKPIFEFLGISVGLNLAGLSIKAKQEAYQKDVTYGVCSEFGFDYLRDHLAREPDERVQRPLAYALIDEIDSILIDEARTPLIIARKTKASPDLYYVCARFVERLQEKRDYEVDRELNQVTFTDRGIQWIETVFMIDNLYHLENTNVYQYLLQSLRAKALMKRDVDYIVRDEKVAIIDAFTGRILQGRQYNDGLQQAIEAKEDVPLSSENVTHAVIMIQKFFSLYTYLTGMTGTIRSEAEEIQNLFGLDIVAIPTHKPVQRIDEEDVFFMTRQEKYSEIMREVKKRHAIGQPVLIGTTSIEQSEEVASRLQALELPYQLLNAKEEEKEASIISAAGLKGAITIATNMAGRGTDIVLGPGVAELGGLHVIGTERHESRRIDNQLRGRSGRQGDPGSSCFYISMEDELIDRFASEEAAQWFGKIQWRESGIREQTLTRWIERVQKRIEQQNYEIRTFVYLLDSVVHEQRVSFYEHRKEVVDGQDIQYFLRGHLVRYVRQWMETHAPREQAPDEWDISVLSREFRLPPTLLVPESKAADRSELMETINAYWDAKLEDLFPLENRSQCCKKWRSAYLQILDKAWMRHLEQLELLKLGIQLRKYGKQDPVQAFKEDAWKLYGQMEETVRKKVYDAVLKERIREGRQVNGKVG